MIRLWDAARSVRSAWPIAWLALLIGGIPWFVAWSTADSYSLAFHLEYFVLMLRVTPLGLMFALLATIPYVIPFGGLISHRYLTYVRGRAPLRQVLATHYVACGLVTFAAFFCIVVSLFMVSYVDQPSYANVYEGGSGSTPETYTTFSELTAHGEWVFAVFIATWIGLHAAMYAWLALSASIVIRHRAAGLSLPWILATVITFAVAILGLESYGPNMVAPFNLTQLPWRNGLVSLAVLTAVSVGLTVLVLVRAPQMDRFQ